VAPRVALIYYSRTGVTRALAERLAEALKGSGASVDVYEVRAVREYSKPLHLNPRLIIDTVFRGGVDVVINPPGLDWERYDIAILAAPIWFGRVAAPMMGFLKRHRCPGKPVVCLTTSMAKVEYSWRLARAAESAGFRVVYHVNVVRGVPSVEVVEEVMRAVSSTRG